MGERKGQEVSTCFLPPSLTRLPGLASLRPGASSRAELALGRFEGHWPPAWPIPVGPLGLNTLPRP